MRLPVKRGLGVLLAAILVCAAGPTRVFAAESSDFSTDDQGWRLVGGAQPSYHSTGGNPGGFISFASAGPAVRSPSAWSGDQSDTFLGTLSFDYRFTGTGDYQQVARLVGNDGSDIEGFDSVFGGGSPQWRSISLALNALNGNAWFAGDTGVDASQIKARLANLLAVEIPPGSFNGSGTTDIDNVKLSPPLGVPRKLKIKHKGGAFTGKLKIARAFPDLPSSCLEHNYVTVFKKRKGPDKKVGKAVTSKAGKYRVRSNLSSGKVYAIVRTGVIGEIESGDGSGSVGIECEPATSKTIKVG